MKRQRATASAVLASISLFVWAVYSLIVASIATWMVRTRYEFNPEATEPRSPQWGSLSLVALAVLAGWLGEVLLWYLLVAYRGQARPGRLRWVALASFAASAIMLVVFVGEDGSGKTGLIDLLSGMIPVLLPLALGGLAAFMLPVRARGDAEFVLPDSATIEAGPTTRSGP